MFISFLYTLANGQILRCESIDSYDFGYYNGCIKNNYAIANNCNAIFKHNLTQA